MHTCLNVSVEIGAVRNQSGAGFLEHFSVLEKTQGDCRIWAASDGVEDPERSTVSHQPPLVVGWTGKRKAKACHSSQQALHWEVEMDAQGENPLRDSSPCPACKQVGTERLLLAISLRLLSERHAGYSGNLQLFLTYMTSRQMAAFNHNAGRGSMCHVPV